MPVFSVCGAPGEPLHGWPPTKAGEDQVWGRHLPTELPLGEPALLLPISATTSSLGLFPFLFFPSLPLSSHSCSHDCPVCSWSQLHA